MVWSARNVRAMASYQGFPSWRASSTPRRKSVSASSRSPRNPASAPMPAWTSGHS